MEREKSHVCHPFDHPEGLAVIPSPTMPDRIDDYRRFISSKAVTAEERGLSEIPPLKKHLFPFQRHCVEFGLRVGSWGLYLDTGLGKTACELEWARHAAEASNGKALILTPLAVARQIEREGIRWGYDIRVIRDQSEAGPGVNVCNYDRLDKLDPDAFGAVALDEASILKSFTGKTTRSLISAFAGHRWRMAATATPAPNDHMELGQYSEYLGIMPSNEMLMRWFITDQTQMGKYRIKGHAVMDFWGWMASWSRMAEHPRDLGDDRKGFDLPPLRVHRHQLSTGANIGEGLFAEVEVSATDIHKIKRLTADERAKASAKIVRETDGPCLVWCDTDYEADALLSAMKRIDGVVEVRGSQSIEDKEEGIMSFVEGRSRVLISKPSICGFGLNLQHCACVVYVGRTFSYESYYQSVRRCWRFGQKNPVDVHLIVAEGEKHVGNVIDRKAGDHAKMKEAMREAMKRSIRGGRDRKVEYDPSVNGRWPIWLR